MDGQRHSRQHPEVIAVSEYEAMQLLISITLMFIELYKLLRDDD